MAESDLITKEDVDEIGGVLQLAPHQKNTTFTTVTKSEEGDLVSLDELYEKTGQEAINTFIKGFDTLVKNNKLGRDHGMALNIQGAESWMVVPDRLNAIRGGEGFFGAIRDGIVTVVKAIIAFISGICNWIGTRIKALIGWGPTAKETEFLHDHSQDVKQATSMVLSSFGVPIDSEFLESLPNGVTITETFGITKKRIADNKEAFEALAAASKYIKGYREKFNSWTADVRSSKREYDRLMTGLRNSARSGKITEGDLSDFILNIADITAKYTDTRKVQEYLGGLVTSLYGIELHELGSMDNFKAVSEELEKVTEEVKVSYDPTYSETIRNATIIIFKNMFTDNGGRTPLKDGLVKELKNIINVKDSEFIQTIDKEYPAAQISAAYLKFSHGISNYSGLLEKVLKIIQKVEISVNNLIRWKDNADCLLSAYIVGDIMGIIAAHDKYLTPEQRQNAEKLIKTGKYKVNASGKREEIVLRVPFITDSIQDVFFNANPSGATLEKISEGMKIFTDTPQGKILLDNYQRFKSQLKG